jgi:peptide/nickel transport system permease protein
MLQRAQEYIWNASWLAVFPGVFIFITVLSFNFLGDGLRDALDPRLKL